MKRITAGVFCLCVVIAAWAQVPGRIAAFQREQDQGVAEPFKGVTTDGKLVSGLFGIRASGVSTEPVRAAVEAFLNGLSQEQRNRTLFPVDDSEWRRWDNRPRVPRQGIGFEEMSERQRQLAFDLFRAGLSAKGLEKAENIMKLNETLAEMRNDWETFGHWRYWITVMGTPSDTEPWGWQLDGHHLVVNYFVLGDQVVMTPAFLGSEPVRAEAGKFKGTVVLQEEQDMGFGLLMALDDGQRAAAILGEKTRTAFLAGAYRDNLTLDYAGIPATRLDGRQRTMLLELMAEYVGNMDEGHARVRMDEVRRHLDETYFAWMGSTAPDGAFYYRIQSPVALIEFDHVGTAPGRERDHIHTIVRTPNGNDYGKDLLRQHYAEYAHPAN